MNTKKVNRRDFVKGSAMAATLAGISMPFNILQAGVSPNEKLNIAFVGMGSRHSQLMAKFFGSEEIIQHLNYVAFCDADSRAFEGKSGIGWGKKYNKEIHQKRFPNVPHFSDYRKMIDKLDKDIDAVSIATTTGNNFSVAMWMLGAGKGAYTEKPTGITVGDARVIMNYSRKNNVVAQMGNQGFSSPHAYILANWCDGNILGDVTEIHHSFGMRDKSQQLASRTGNKTVPKYFNWDAYQNVNPADFYDGGTHQNFKDNTDHQIPGHGMTPHSVAAPMYAFKLFKAESVKLIKCDPHVFGAVPSNHIVEIKYPARDGLCPCKVTMYGMTMGSKWGAKLGGLHSKYMPKPEGFTDEQWDKNNFYYYQTYIGSKATAYRNGESTPRISPETKMKEMTPEIAKLPNNHKPVKLSKQGQGQNNHVMNFIDACRANDYKKADSNFDISGPVMELLNLVAVAAKAQKVGKELIYDYDNLKFTNDEDATSLLTREYRESFMNWKKTKR